MMILYRPVVVEVEVEVDTRVPGPSLPIKMAGGRRPQTETEETREDGQTERPREKFQAGGRPGENPEIPGGNPEATPEATPGIQRET